MDRHRKPAEDRDGLEQRLRLAFLQGAERQSMAALGRGLTEDELRRVLARYPKVESRPSR